MDLVEQYPKFKSYPPTPNWYLSDATAISEPYFFLYATQNYVVVLGLKDMAYFNSWTASFDKINAIAAYETYCFTAGIDQVIRKWDMTSGSLISTHYAHSSEIVALKVIRNGTITISGDKSGKVVVIDELKQLKTSMNNIRSEVKCLAVTTYNANDYIAIGYANGMISIECIDPDLTLRTIFQVADENHDPILSLDWQHISSNDSDRWPLLATSTERKKSANIWSPSTESIVATIKLPNPPSQSTDKQKTAVTVKVSWSPHETNKIYITSYIGAILCFQITNNNRNVKPCGRLEKHNRNIFSMNWYNEGNNLITTSLDKQIINWDAKKKVALQCLMTQGAFPYSIDTPNWNKGQLAVGLGDNCIKIWNFSGVGSVVMNASSKNPRNYYSAAVFWKGLQGKVEKVKYHPARAGVLAYATDYGHVGMYDIFSSKSTPFKKTHGSCNKTPSIGWGLDMTAVLQDEDMQDTFLSCSLDGIVRVYDTSAPSASPINLNERLEEVNPAWFASLLSKSDSSNRVVIAIDEKAKYLACGHRDGLVEVFLLTSLKLIYASDYHRHQLITALDWKYVDNKLLLASGSDQSAITVHNISDIDPSNVPDVPIPEKSPYYIFEGHQKGITDLKWSHHVDDALLASTSEDNFVAVWALSKKTPVSLFNRHRSKTLSVCWNQFDLDVLFSGSADRFIYEFKYTDFVCTDSISTYRNLFDLEKNILRSNENNNMKRKAAEDSSNLNYPIPGASITDVPKTFSLKKKVKKSQSTNTTTPKNTITTTTTTLTNVTIKKSGSMTTVLQESEKSISQLRREKYCMFTADTMLKGKVKEAIEYIKTHHLTEDLLIDPITETYCDFCQTQEPNELERQGEMISNLFFGDKNDMHQLAKIESEALEEKQQTAKSLDGYVVQKNNSFSDVKLAIDIMRCQYSVFDREQLDINMSSSLMDWIILALSPMAGKQAWMDLMLKQAQKLEISQQIHLAAACYIACTHIYEAIDLFKKNGMYREAIALAKLRLPETDPIMEKLYNEWGIELEKTDQDTLAATCYLLSKGYGSMTNAVNSLARSGTESGLFFAACLAIASDDATKNQRVEQWLTKLKSRVSSTNKSSIVDDSLEP